MQRAAYKPDKEQLKQLGLKENEDRKNPVLPQHRAARTLFEEPDIWGESVSSKSWYLLGRPYRDAITSEATETEILSMRPSKDGMRYMSQDALDKAKGRTYVGIEEVLRVLYIEEKEDDPSLPLMRRVRADTIF